MLNPIEGCPSLYRDTDTGNVVNMRDFKPMDKTWPWPNVDIVLQAGESWILRNWSVVIHPFPEVIPPDIKVRFAVNSLIWSEVPLFTIAEPLASSEAFEQRAKRLEAALGKADIEGRALNTEKIADAMLDMFHRNEAGRLPDRYLNNPITVEIKTKGPPEAMSTVYNTEHFLVRLQGMRRPPVTR